ncbi:sIgD [Platysternon megacephalum]|uniref:SIgD n=1 Tax=Platysternon megacephalum TaxID=55544 RepID=A0A4D9DRB0_9SAUR|nr:sIgD [Platysternon megacephalum]
MVPCHHGLFSPGPHDLSPLSLQDKHWRWTDGSLYRYSAWNAEEPNNKYDEYCVELVNHTGFKNWNDRTCEKENAYVCKYGLERRK